MTYYGIRHNHCHSRVLMIILSGSKWRFGSVKANVSNRFSCSQHMQHTRHYMLLLLSKSTSCVCAAALKSFFDLVKPQILPFFDLDHLLQFRE